MEKCRVYGGYSVVYVCTRYVPHNHVQPSQASNECVMPCRVNATYKTDVPYNIMCLLVSVMGKILFMPPYFSVLR